MPYHAGRQEYWRWELETFETIRTLLAVRAYRPDPIPEVAVQRILEAGRLTGSALNRQPWRFIAVRSPETLRRLGELSTRGPYIGSAPLCVAVCVGPAASAPLDGTRAVQSMMLAAWDQGIGSNWVTPADDERPAFAATLGIPEAWRLLTLLPFGYPAQPIGRGRKNRLLLEEVAFRDRFGDPYA